MRYQITEGRPNGGKRGVSYGRGSWVPSRGSLLKIINDY